MPEAPRHPARAPAQRAGGRRPGPRAAIRVIAARRGVLAAVSAGGALGSLARWGVAAALPQPAGGFPWATFLANVSGCLLIGALVAVLAEVAPPSKYARPFLGVGVLGGYTTFSSLMLDTRTLLIGGRAALAGAYLASSLAAGLAAVWAGAAGARAAARSIRAPARASSGRLPRGAAGAELGAEIEAETGAARL